MPRGLCVRRHGWIGWDGRGIAFELGGAHNTSAGDLREGVDDVDDHIWASNGIAI